MKVFMMVLFVVVSGMAAGPEWMLKKKNKIDGILKFKTVCVTYEGSHEKPTPEVNLNDQLSQIDNMVSVSQISLIANSMGRNVACVVVGYKKFD